MRSSGLTKCYTPADPRQRAGHTQLTLYADSKMSVCLIEKLTGTEENH